MTKHRSLSINIFSAPKRKSNLYENLKKLNDKGRKFMYIGK